MAIEYYYLSDQTPIIRQNVEYIKKELIRLNHLYGKGEIYAIDFERRKVFYCGYGMTMERRTFHMELKPHGKDNVTKLTLKMCGHQVTFTLIVPE